PHLDIDILRNGIRRFEDEDGNEAAVGINLSTGGNGGGCVSLHRKRRMSQSLERMKKSTLHLGRGRVFFGQKLLRQSENCGMTTLKRLHM
ncbi:unnamed protein product, partial [Orchesella dallaii]